MNIDKQALREAAEKAQAARARLESFPDEDVVLFEDDDIKSDVSACNKFFVLATPATMLELLDELDSANGYASAYEAEKWHYHGLAESEGERADRAEKQVEELTMWVKRLAHSLRNARPNSKLHGAAMVYLIRKGLISVEDVLR